MADHLKCILYQGCNFPLLLGGLITAFILLSLATQNGYLLRFDQSILTSFHHLRTPWLDHYFSAITWLGSLWILIPLYLIYMFFYGIENPAMAKMFTILFWGSVITTYALKYLLERKRPHFFGPIHELPLDPSFPSAHSAQIAAFAIGIGITFYASSTPYQNGAITLLAFVSLSIFASRMYLQVHFPTDILGGIIVALSWAAIALWGVYSGVQR
ncbi:phosphatase PAP2 family protein [Sulfuricurvum sp.]|uniref:phosphatase PAP2 family protein n=1 Tax=Sulfuricurvum sp. TaxID=2025608 RepID=UPI002622A356|nr:phosphatase PAP2 family protein [Sulfuricurvum sp.]MDD2780736.1 phosphatase PAP2 family protein [Sulfuricurvum sp.]